MSAAFGASAYANPSGPSVASGSASFATSGKTLTVTNTPGAIINWQQFSIQKDEVTRFIQQSAASSVLNRVTTQSPSQILGRLSSNGRVFLINPNGIAFGAGSVIDVAGFAASTLNLSDADWLAGRMRFAGTGLEGKLTHAGTIQTAEGGQVYLVAPNVETQAGSVISSPKGEVVIAAGKTVELVNAATPDIRVEYSAPEHQAINAGSVLAASGSVGIYGTLIRNSGAINASRAEAGDGGRITLKAAKDITLEATSRIEASGATAGAITVQAEAGTLLAQGAIEAKGESAKGGEIKLLGTNVGLIGTATVDASGNTGGGTILIGGDFQGKNADIQNAWRTYVGPDATIRANAITEGDGGKVIVWADDITRAYGSISARGGAQSGDGGFIEVSGKGQLDFTARVDASATNGLAGTLLLDPTNITVAAGGTSATTDVDAFTDSGGTLTISPTTLDAAAATVVLQATNDVTVQNTVNLGTAGAGFVAQAGRDITINASVTTKGGNIILEADSPHAPSGSDGVGQVKINAAVSTLGSGATGGSITLIGGGNASPGGGFSIKADVTAGTGGLNLSLTNSGTLNFGIGAGGNTQLTSKDTDHLMTTGALVIGRAISAGPAGQGGPPTEIPSTGPVTLLVNSITNSTSTPIELSAASGSSFELAAGAGGITLDKPLTAYQDTIINTTGPLAINQTLATSDNNLTLQASSVSVGSSGSINIGSGSCLPVATCSSLGVITSQIFWDGEIDNNWFDPRNWRLSGSDPDNVLPDLTREVTIDNTVSFGIIQIATGSAAQARSLVSGRPIVLSSGSLEVTNASSFNDFTVSGGNATFNGGATAGTFALSSGAVNGSGIFSVTSDFNQTGGTVGTFTNLSLNRNTNFVVGSLTAANDLTLTTTNGGNLTVNGALSAGGKATLASVASVTLGALSSVTAGAGGDSVVISGTTFINNAGASVLSVPAGGRWLVYSAGPAGDVFGPTAGNVLASGNQAVWNATFAGDPPATISSGNRYVFSAQPTLTYSANAIAREYGDANPAFSGSVSGFVDAAAYNNVFTQDTLANSTTGTLSFSSPATASSTVGSYAINGSGLTANNGNYVFTQAVANATALTISPATLSVVADAKSKVYGDADPALTYVASGFKLSDTSASVLSGGLTRVAGETVVAPGPTYAINQGTVTANGNYTIAYTGNNLTISPATLSYVANAASREYGDANPAFSGTVTGFKLSETQASATKGALAFTSPATASSNVGSYAIDGSGLTANNGNYVFTQAAGNATALTINPAVVGLSGNRIYDSTVNYAGATFGSGGTINGKNGETLLVTGNGAVASPNVVAGTQPLTLGTLALANGTGAASNYTLAGGTHTGTITPATLTYVADTASRKVGDPNPTFTGSVTGFVAGETLVSATTGTLAFASPATITSPEGQYPINGSGLSANNGNYMFVQAPSNATALTILTITSAAAQSAYQSTVNSTNNAAPNTTIGTGTGPQDQALGSSQAFLQTQSGETVLLTAVPGAQGGTYVNIETGEQVVITPTETPAPGIYYNEQTSTVVAVTTEEGSNKPVVLTGTASSETVTKGGKARLVASVGCK